MRYLAICLLSLITSAATSGALPVTAPSVIIEVAAPVMGRGEGLRRDGLAVLVGAALVALQLRRRQKSFGMPRALG